jgi:hypothetical protein
LAASGRTTCIRCQKNPAQRQKQLSPYRVTWGACSVLKKNGVGWEPMIMITSLELCRKRLERLKQPSARCTLSFRNFAEDYWLSTPNELCSKPLIDSIYKWNPKLEGLSLRFR